MNLNSKSGTVVPLLTSAAVSKSFRYAEAEALPVVLSKKIAYSFPVVPNALLRGLFPNMASSLRYRKSIAVN